MSVLKIKNLHVSIETEDGEKEILTGISMTIKSGEVHAIMGPNGSGKSTLAYSLAGHPKYKITNGSIFLDDKNVLDMDIDTRARLGIFLAMQYPTEISGITVTNFLRTAKTAVSGKTPNIRTWSKELHAAMHNLKMDKSFSTRSINEGFSGGEKKRHEILQLELLEPKFAILDETDSGLDIDALRIVAENINRIKNKQKTGLMLITHYTRILHYIKPDFVHVFVKGNIIREGGPELAEILERDGYDQIAS